ncbi:MAG TPA: hypothetical protein VEI82_10145, partial [Myxococcota bacterium]|nr:hypothetical protein [Myxococcota bacterium]
MILLALGLAGTARSADYTIRPQIDLEEFHDDNVLSAENELASWGTHISPSIFLLRKSETTDANLQVGFTR